ncbi:MAG: phosphoenolpyruvate mutase [Rhodospirillales bacterium]|nr:phosphoenolpyruvate mutase [Rhodospirillales bacterium]MBO6788813.1 phosphoenolpyruvate mutase [Rhodospirillales bacterium]
MAEPNRSDVENSVTRRKTTLLKGMLQSPELEFIMEAHNGLSAKIVEEAGFKGIWASGLSMSAALGVRDSNEASWTQVLDVLEFMSDASSLPILVDGDTGWGNFNNLRRAVQKFHQRGIAGICIEDKLFPKTNSFIGEGQPLADMDEFCGKIKAGKDSQLDDDFQIVARVEALIAGWGLDEALRRAEAYHEAGADAILIHSKKSTSDEVVSFLREWGDRSPVVLVPTKYYTTPTSVFEEAGASMVIWANHNMRAAITAMREATNRIFRDKSLEGVEREVVTVSDVFDLMGNAELADAERRYLPKRADGARAVVLAASRGSSFGDMTEDKPKCMLEVRGQPLLRRLVDIFRAGGVRDVTVVRGHRKEAINLPDISTVDNDLYERGGEVSSLACAMDALQGPCYVAYGDILFRQYFIDLVEESDADITVVADAQWQARTSESGEWVRDFVTCTRPYSASYLVEDPAYLVSAGEDIAEDQRHGEWTGLMRLSEKGAQVVRDEIDAIRNDGSLNGMDIPQLLTRLAQKGQKIAVVYVSGQWLDVDDYADLIKAGQFL